MNENEKDKYQPSLPNEENMSRQVRRQLERSGGEIQNKITEERAISVLG